MNSVLEIMKATELVRFHCLHDRKLFYQCVRRSEMAAPSRPDIGMSVTDGFADSSWGIEILFTFSIPLSDTDGGVFYAWDDKPMFYMRWIRKQLEADVAEQEMITRAKEDWERENASHTPSECTAPAGCGKCRELNGDSY